MIKIKIGRKTKELVDWCLVFDTPYNTAWGRYSRGERDPVELFRSRKRDRDAVRTKIEKMCQTTPKKEEVIGSTYKSDEIELEMELLPVQTDIHTLTQTRDILLVDVLGESLLAELRRECRYQYGVPVTQAINEAVKLWLSAAQVKRAVDREQRNGLRNAERNWQ